MLSSIWERLESRMEHIEAGYFHPSNLFFMNTVFHEEKKELIESKHINTDMIKNRLQNAEISQEERDILEDYI